jgi:hypothetical protein
MTPLLGPSPAPIGISSPMQESGVLALARAERAPCNSYASTISMNTGSGRGCRLTTRPSQ